MENNTILAFIQLSKNMHGYKGSVGITHQILKLCGIDEIIAYYCKCISNKLKLKLKYDFIDEDKCVVEQKKIHIM